MRAQHHAGGIVTWRFAVDGPDVTAVFTTRHGGCSSGPYAGLNLAYHVGDDPACVAANRSLVCEALGVDRLTVADQQHGCAVAVVDAALAGAGHGSEEDSRARLAGVDALVTDRPGAALAVLVADCAPVVLVDPVHRALGVAHAGRAGVCVDVVGATVRAMEERFGSCPPDLRAGVGPCIGAANYEIADGALDAVRDAFGDDLLQPTSEGRARFDLSAAVRRRLADAGVDGDAVDVMGVDTAAAGADLFSDRVARPCGRSMLIAALRP